MDEITKEWIRSKGNLRFVHIEGRISAAIDVEQCDRRVPDGEWKHRKGVKPCRPVNLVWINEVGKLPPEKEKELFEIIEKGTVHIMAGQRGGKSIQFGCRDCVCNA